jgi:transmembrane sensor
VMLAFGWRRDTPAPARYSATVATAVGEVRKLALPDGSTVVLNPDARLVVEFVAHERRIALGRGEAYFQVAKDPQRPFIVGVGSVAVRAVGTAFDVRRRADAVEVLVTEGKVRVDAASDGHSLLANTGVDRPVLLAGQRVVVPLAESGMPGPAVPVAVTPSQISEALAWRERRLDFKATPLAEIVAEFNRYNEHKLVIVDPALADRRFGGTFLATDYEEFVRALEADFEIVAERTAAETRLRRAP